MGQAMVVADVMGPRKPAPAGVVPIHSVLGTGGSSKGPLSMTDWAAMVPAAKSAWLRANVQHDPRNEWVLLGQIMSAAEKLTKRGNAQ